MVSFMFDGAFSPYDYAEAEQTLNNLLQETHCIESAYAEQSRFYTKTKWKVTLTEAKGLKK